MKSKRFVIAEPRGCRFALAVVKFFGLGLGFAAATAGIGTRNAVLSVLVYICYLICEGAILIRLTSVLYRQHRLQAMKFNVEALLLLTTIVALPLGTARLAISQAQESFAGQTAVVVAILALSLFPLLSVCEAIVVWSTAVRKRLRSR